MLKISILLFLLSIATIRYSFGQQKDTIYHDEHDNVVSGKFDHYHIAEQENDLVKFTGYSKSGKLLMEGHYKTRDLKDATGPFYHYKKNKLIRFELYEPIKYPELLHQYKDVLSKMPEVSDSISLCINYYKNGKIESFGYIKECLLQGIWYNFDKSGTLEYTINYKDDKANGTFTLYIENTPVIEGKYIDGKETGEWYVYDKERKLIKILRFVAGKKVKEIHVKDFSH